MPVPKCSGRAYSRYSSGASRPGPKFRYPRTSPFRSATRKWLPLPCPAQGEAKDVSGLLPSEQAAERVLVEDGHAELLCLGQLAARLVAGHKVVGFRADR